MRPDPARFDPDALTRTVALIEEAGHTVDRDLWLAPDKALLSVAADALAALADLEAPGFPSPGRTRTGPTRGFVIPSGS